MCSSKTYVALIAALLLPAIVPTVLVANESNRTHHLSGNKRHTLWIPGDYQHQDNKVDVLVNFHGSAPLVQSSTRFAGLNCAVISVNYAGLSSVYRVPFSNDRRLFATLLEEALKVLRAKPNIPDDAEWGKVAISSFSAGFGAVREILKTQDYFDRIDGIYMVDSMYSGYVGDGTGSIKQGVVHPGLMKDFLRFAQATANGDKVMIVTHCVGPTPGYASTRETADYLLEKLDIQPEPVDIEVQLPPEAELSKGKLNLYRQAKQKGFSLYGSPGSNVQDHGEHLRHMAYFLPGLPLAKQDAQTVAREKHPSAESGSVHEVTIHADIPFTEVDGVELLLNLHLPKNVDNPPLVMFIHGGGWKNGDRSRCRMCWVATSGYAVASIEYRLSHEGTFPAQIHDCKGALRWLRAHQDKYGYDAERVVVAGTSAGGHLAALMGTSGGVTQLEGTTAGHTDQSSLVQGAIDYYGPSDFILRAKNQPSKTDDPKGSVYQLLGGPVSQNQDKARLASPAFHVDSSDPPLLIIHGENDKTVHLAQSKRLAALYKDKNLDVQLRVEPGKGHGWRPPSEDEKSQVLNFLEKQLRKK